jgi:hypothetical protein
MRGNQYAAAPRLHHRCLWNTGSPACAGDDDRDFFARTEIFSPDITSRSRGAMHPKSCISFRPRGRGECRVPNAPAASCALCSWSMHTSIHSGGTGNIRHSPRDGFTAYCALSPGTGLFCPRRSRDKPATLTPASGRQDHTPLPSASSAFVSHAISVHHIPLSTSVTIAIRPSCGGGIAGRIHNFCFSESEIFVRGQLQPRSA